MPLTQIGNRRKKHGRKKIRVGMYGITGCAGCQLTVLFAKDRILDLLDMIDFVAVPFIKGKNEFKGKLDVVLMEGLVASKEDLERLKKIRARTKILIGVGACATHGCVPAMRNFMNEPEVQRAAYAKVDYLNSLDATPIDKHIKVDYYLPGCPPDENEIISVLKDIVLGYEPRIVRTPVCVECTKLEIPCLLEQGKACLGPVTRGGCNAICTQAGHECTGCRGPSEDANIKAYIKALQDKGFSREDIEKRLHTYAGFAVDELEKKAGVLYRSEEL
jgi:coenzyme F420-reducing hydrogenase gamma subunit